MSTPPASTTTSPPTQPFRPTTSLIKPPSTLDDEPEIHPPLARFIKHLPDTHKPYTRFFSALLIPGTSHPQIFHDLRQFREQPAIIYQLSLDNSQSYREVTSRFVTSRFAHPWCRVAPGDAGQQGWRRASWVDAGRSGKGKDRLAEVVRKEEDRLHRLLVPIWISFRKKMFPGDDVVGEWSVEQDRLDVERAEQAKQDALEAKSKPTVDADGGGEESKVYPELGFALKSESSSAISDPPDHAAAEAASKMFVGAAMAAFVMSDKRVKKYVQKKLLKKK